VGRGCIVLTVASEGRRYLKSVSLRQATTIIDAQWPLQRGLQRYSKTLPAENRF
jgi:hypothetical protein